MFSYLLLLLSCDCKEHAEGLKTESDIVMLVVKHIQCTLTCNCIMESVCSQHCPEAGLRKMIHYSDHGSS